MWYMDGHILKNLYLKGLHLITFLDDASRCVPEQTCSEKPHQRIRVSSDRPLKGLEHLSLYSQATGLVLWTCTKGSKKIMKTSCVQGRSLERVHRSDKLWIISSTDQWQFGEVTQKHQEKIYHYESLLKYIEYYKRRLLFTGHWQLKSCSICSQLRR